MKTNPFLQLFLGIVLVFTILEHYCTCIRVLKCLYMYLIWSYTCKLLIHIYKYTHTYIYRNKILRLHITEARGYSLLGLGKCFSHAIIKLPVNFCSKFRFNIKSHIRLDTFACFLSSADFFSIIFFLKNIFPEHHQFVKEVESKSGPTKC